MDLVVAVGCDGARMSAIFYRCGVRMHSNVTLVNHHRLFVCWPNIPYAHISRQAIQSHSPKLFILRIFCFLFFFLLLFSWVVVFFVRHGKMYLFLLSRVQFVFVDDSDRKILRIKHCRKQFNKVININNDFFRRRRQLFGVAKSKKKKNHSKRAYSRECMLFTRFTFRKIAFVNETFRVRKCTTVHLSGNLKKNFNYSHLTL